MGNKLSFHLPFILASGLILLLSGPAVKIELFDRFEEVFSGFFYSIYSPSLHNDILIIDIDSNSIDLLSSPDSQGNSYIRPSGMPRRGVLASVIKTVLDMDAKVVVVDLLMTKNGSVPQEDREIASLSSAPNVVHSIAFDQINSPKISMAPPSDMTLKKFAIGESGTFIIEFLNASHAKKPYPILRRAVNRAGHITVLKKPNSHWYSRFPLALNYNGYIIPSLTLAALTVYFDSKPLWKSKAVEFGNPESRALIPIDKNAVVTINFLDYQSILDENRNRVSFAEIYFDPSGVLLSLKDKIVIIGSSVGKDTFPSPNSNEIPGWLIHASIINSVLQNKYLRTSSWGGTFFAFIVMVILQLTSFYFKQQKTLNGLLFLPAILFVSVNLVGLVFFINGWLLKMMLPNIGILFFFMVRLGFRLLDNLGSKKKSKRPTHAHQNHVFISYSRHDRKWLKKLQTHLKPLSRNHEMQVWDDTKLPPGTVWQEALEKALARSKVAVLLVSPTYLASDFILKHELNPFFKAAKEKTLTILWIPITASRYDATPIVDYQAVFDPSKPLDTFSPAKQHQALVDVSKKIEAAVNVYKK